MYYIIGHNTIIWPDTIMFVLQSDLQVSGSLSAIESFVQNAKAAGALPYWPGLKHISCPLETATENARDCVVLKQAGAFHSSDMADAQCSGCLIRLCLVGAVISQMTMFSLPEKKHKQTITFTTSF